MDLKNVERELLLNRGKTLVFLADAGPSAETEFPPIELSYETNTKEVLAGKDRKAA